MPDQDDDSNPEEGDEYIITEVLPPRGDRYQRETVAHKKRNVDEKLIGLRNANSILGTKVYGAVFPGGEGL